MFAFDLVGFGLVLGCVCFGFRTKPIMGLQFVFVSGLVGFGLGLVCVCVFALSSKLNLKWVSGVCMCECVCVCWLWVWCTFALDSKLNL